MAQERAATTVSTHSDETLEGDRSSQDRKDPPMASSKDESAHDDEADAAKPRSVGFWHKELGATRKDVFKHYWFMLGILCAFILAVLSIYWGSLFNAEKNLNSIIVYVINFETESDAIVGPVLTGLTEQIVAANDMPHLGFVTVPPSAFENDPMQVREAIYGEQAWAALVVMPNATQMLRQAVSLGNSSYDPNGACQLIYVDSRDQDSFYNYVLPEVSQVQTQFVAKVGQKWASEIMSNQSISRTTLSKVPQAVSPAIGFSTFSLRPFSPYVAVPGVSVGLIYLIILSFFSFSFFLPIHMKFTTPDGHPTLHFHQLVIWRWFAAIQSYFFMSLAYSLISVAFQIPFSNPPASHLEVTQGANAFGKATFVVYWMLNFVGMSALGMACENVAMVIGFPWTSMWLIFWVITNVATSFYPIDVEAGFYAWGYAWPLHNVVEGSRTLLFDLHSRLGLNFGILLAWCAVNTVLFPLCSWFMRWKQMREKKKQSGSG